MFELYNKKMKKIIISFLLVLSIYSYGANNDSIQLNSTVDPVCSVDFTPEPVASNLDITTSASHLMITKFNMYTNTEHSSTHTSNLSLDLAGALTHSNTINQFNFDMLEFENTDAATSGTLPFGTLGIPISKDSTEVDLFLSYTGVPALSLVQGTYSAEWFIGCSVEPI